MKKFLLLLAFLVYALVSYSQEKMKVAVLPVYDEEQSVLFAHKHAIRSNLITAIANSEGYIAMDMGSVDAIIDVAAFHESGLVKEDERIELGNIPGMKYMLKIEVSSDDSYILFIVSLLETETGIFVHKGSANEYSEKNIPSIQEACIRLTNKLFAEVVSLVKDEKHGTFTDSRDGKIYITVKIGNQTWMAENLNFTTAEGSWCYENDSTYCEKYGRLYSWETAREVCPAGWHLPSKSEFETLLSNVGGSGSNAYYALKDCGSSGFNALFG